MTKPKKIRFGIPKGNLNMPLPINDEDINNYRGHTAEFLRLAGFKMVNYEPGKERSERDADGKPLPIYAEGEPDIEFYCMRPRNQLPALLHQGKLDFAIIGKDSVEEFYSSIWKINWPYLVRPSPEGFAIVKEKRRELWNNTRETIKSNPNIGHIEDLGYGKMDLYWETLPNNPFTNRAEDYGNGCLPIASAFPNITLGEVCRHVESHLIDFVEGDTAEGPDFQARINPFSSNTEEMIKLGYNIIFDGVSSGSALRRNGLVTRGAPILSSTAQLYSNMHIRIRMSAGDWHPKSLGRREDIYKVDIGHVKEIIQRLKEARQEYAAKYKDSIYYEGGNNEKSK